MLDNPNIKLSVADQKLKSSGTLDAFILRHLRWQLFRLIVADNLARWTREKPNREK